MAPLIVQILATLAARVRLNWRDAVRVGLGVMFLFTAVSHFSPLRKDMAAMIPPPLTGALWVVDLTGVLEALGAIGLLTARFRRVAAWCLILLVLAMFPANVYAALADVKLGGRAPSALWWRTPLQGFWILLLWWSAASAKRSDAHAASPPVRAGGG